MILYSTGYSGVHHEGRAGKIAAFDAMIERENLIVCDIRLQPRSQSSYWRKTTLLKRLGGDRYCSIPELGNENYLRGGSFVLRDWQAGLRLLISAAAASKRIPLLLCACEEEKSCHRSLVAKTLRDLGHTVTEITRWDLFK